MAGFPARTSHRALGGNRSDAMRVTNPQKQVAAAVFNAIQWQVAGMNRTAPLVTLTIESDGARASGTEVWNDQDDEALRVTITHDSTGEYQITAAASYPDENGTLQPVEFHGAIATVHGATSVRPPQITLDSPNQITVYTFDASGAAADQAFTLDIK